MYYCCADAVRVLFVFCQAEDGIRDLVRSRGLGDVYKRQVLASAEKECDNFVLLHHGEVKVTGTMVDLQHEMGCLLYTSDAADERSSVDLGGRRIIKKKTRP